MEKQAVIEILKKFEQQDYRYGGVSIAPEMYDAIATHIIIMYSNTFKKRSTVIEALKNLYRKLIKFK